MTAYDNQVLSNKQIRMNKVDVTIPFTIETHAHCRPSCMLGFIAHDVVHITSAVCAIVMRKLSSVFCISVFFEMELLKLTLIGFVHSSVPKMIKISQVNLSKRMSLLSPHYC